MSTTTPRRTLALAAAMAITGLGFVSSPAALAATASAPAGLSAMASVSPNPGLIDPTQPSTLHITKYAGAQTGGVNNGTQQTINSTPLAGVTYRITQVSGVDLTTNAGWTAAASYYDSVPGTTPPLTTNTFTGTTAADGTLNFANLPVGLYYVEEIGAPAGYTRAAPFVVTLPMTNPTNQSDWMYDVYVYPKNPKDTATKTVADQGTQTAQQANGAAADHVVDYTINSSITPDLTGAAMGMYVVSDNLDPRLSYTGAEVTLSNGAALTRCATATDTTCDYKVFVGADGGTLAFQGADATVTGGPTVNIVFTDAGLAKLAANSTATVQTLIHTRVDSEGNGTINNQATFIPNQAWWDQNKGTNTNNPETPDVTPPPTNPPGVPTDTTVSKYGDFQIHKTNADQSVNLAGAEFTLYKDANGDGTCAPAEMVAANVIAGPLVTDASGLATFQGLQLSNWYDGKAQTQLTTYCTVETKAPTGYNLNPQPVAFTVTKEGAVVDLATQSTTVTNELSNLSNDLPLTGGAGAAALSLGGLAIVGGTLAARAASKRRRDDEDADLA